MNLLRFRGAMPQAQSPRLGGGTNNGVGSAPHRESTDGGLLLRARRGLRRGNRRHKRAWWPPLSERGRLRKIHECLFQYLRRAPSVICGQRRRSGMSRSRHDSPPPPAIRPRSQGKHGWNQAMIGGRAGSQGAAVRQRPAPAANGRNVSAPAAAYRNRRKKFPGSRRAGRGSTGAQARAKITTSALAKLASSPMPRE